MSPLNSLPCRCVSRQSSAAAAQLAPSAAASLQLGCPKPLRFSPVTAVEKKRTSGPAPKGPAPGPPRGRGQAEPGTAFQKPLGHYCEIEI